MRVETWSDLARTRQNNLKTMKTISLSLLFTCVSLAASAQSMPDSAALFPGEQRIYEPDEGITNGDRYGASMAVHGEWAVVGAPGDDVRESIDSGAAYVLKRTSGVWQVVQKLHAADAGPVLEFGSAVAIHGEVLAVVAKPVSALIPGVVTIYRRSGEVWAMEQTLSLNASAVTLSADQLIVGLPKNGETGRVRVYEKAGTSWSQVQEIQGPAAATEGLRFGYSLALNGNRLLVGAPGSETLSLATNGQAREFERTGSGWVQVRMISAPVVMPRSIAFGEQVALSDHAALVTDWRGIHYGPTGRRTSFIPFGTDPTVGVYRVANGQWVRQEPLVSTTNISQVCIAAQGIRALIASNGAVRELLMNDGPTSDWVRRTIVLAEPGRPMLSGPYVAAIAQDAETGLVGWQGAAEYYDQGPGTVYSFSGQTEWEPGASVQPDASRAQPNSHFGHSMVISGNTAVVGAPFFSGQTSGCVYLLQRVGALWQIEKILDAPSGTRFFGLHVGISGDRIAVSSRLTMTGAPESSRVFIYEKSEFGWASEPTETLEEQGELNDLMFSGNHLAYVVQETTVKVHHVADAGISLIGTVVRPRVGDYDWVNLRLSLHESKLAVADASWNLGKVTNFGRVTLYDLGEDAMTQSAEILAPPSDGVTYNGFGFRVTLSTTRLFVEQSYNSRPSRLLTYRLQDGTWELMDGAAPIDSGNENFAHTRVGGGDYFLVGNYGQWARLFRVERGGLSLLRQHSGNGRTAFAHSVALSPDTMIIRGGFSVGRPNGALVSMLSFLPTGNLGADSEPGAPEVALGTDQTIELGEILVGETLDLPLRVVNRGLRNVRLTGAAVSGDAASVQSVQLDPVTLSSGEVAVARVALRPSAEGSYSPRITIQHENAALGEVTYTLHYTATLSRRDLTISAPSASLTLLGERLSIRPTIDGTRPYTCHWFKDGRALASQTEATLDVPRASAEDAGIYRLEVRWPGGKVRSEEIRVGIYQNLFGLERVLDADNVTLPARAWGPGVSFQWSVNESWAITGTRSARLHAKRADVLLLASNAEGNGSRSLVTASVRLGDQTAVCSHFDLELRRPPVINVMGPPGSHVFLITGEELNLGLNDISESRFIPTYGASRLPSELTLVDGVVTGVFTQPGRYLCTFTASNPDGVAKPVDITILVYPAEEGVPGQMELTFGPPGLFANFLELPAGTRGIERPALILMQVTGTGSFTGSVLYAGKRQSLSGQFKPDPTNPRARIARQPLPSIPGHGRLYMEISQEAYEIEKGLTAEQPVMPRILAFEEMPADMEDSNISTTFLSPELRLSKPDRLTVMGQHSILLSSYEFDDPVPDPAFAPDGSGFASMNFNQNLQGNATGTLPDGSGITFSAPLVVDAESYLPVLLVLHDAGVKGIVRGKISITFDGQTSNLTSEELRWTRPPNSSSKLYPDGLDAVLLARGGRYVVPKNLPLLLDGDSVPATTRSILRIEGGGAEPGELPFSLTSAHRANFAKPNAYRAKLDLYYPTGFFTGSITPSGSSAPISLRGMIIPQLNRGEGFFLLPQPRQEGAAPQTFSGKVLLQPAE